MKFFRNFLVCLFAVSVYCHRGHHHGDGNHDNKDEIMCEGEQAMDVTNKLMEKDTNLFVKLVFESIHVHVNYVKKMPFLRPTYNKIKTTLGNDVVAKLRGDKKTWSEKNREKLIETLIEKDVELLATLACGTVKYHAKKGRKHGKGKEVDALEKLMGKDFMSKIGHSEWGWKKKLMQRMAKQGHRSHKDRHDRDHKDRHDRDHKDRRHRDDKDHHHGHHDHKDHRYGHHDHEDHHHGRGDRRKDHRHGREDRHKEHAHRHHHHHGHRDYKDHGHEHQGEFCPQRHVMVKKLRQQNENLFNKNLLGAVSYFASNHKAMPELERMWRRIEKLFDADFVQRALSGGQPGNRDMATVIKKMERDPELMATLTCGSVKWIVMHPADSPEDLRELQKLLGENLLQELKGSPWPWEMEGEYARKGNHHEPGSPKRHDKLNPKLHKLIEYLKHDPAMVEKILGHYTSHGSGNPPHGAVKPSPMPHKKQPVSYASPMPPKRQTVTYASPMPPKRQTVTYASPMPPKRQTVSYASPMPPRKH